MTPLTRAALRARDATDPLAAHRARFHLPAGVVYLDGNSLGALPKATVGRIRAVTEVEWGQQLIRSWNSAGWIDLPTRIGDKIAQLIGAAPGEVIVSDSTSINVFKALAAALALNPGRRTILSQRDNFPTDLYMAQGLIQHLGGRHTLKLVAGEEVARHITRDVAVVMLTHVNYRSGRIHDIASLTQAAHAKGALVLWDLCHTAGALPVDLGAMAADFAVGCGYKYLNGGPGAPAFIYVARRHQPRFSQPLSGWLGHAEPFAFDPDYRPAEGVGRYVCGTPPVLSMAALECGVDGMLAAGIPAVRAKSVALTELFIALVEARCRGHGLELISPREAACRGSQVSFRHPEGYAIMQALAARGVIGDFRAPDVLRFGFTPLYLRFVDVWDATSRLRAVLRGREWDVPEYRQRQKVT
ncbi:MAG TPA: kynureninase [Ktedonobacterales bacterium]|nr:kynureninase [Ktedonobacterales bacterium]